MFAARGPSRCGTFYWIITLGCCQVLSLCVCALRFKLISLYFINTTSMSNSRRRNMLEHIRPLFCAPIFSLTFKLLQLADCELVWLCIRDYWYIKWVLGFMCLGAVLNFIIHFAKRCVRIYELKLWFIFLFEQTCWRLMWITRRFRKIWGNFLTIMIGSFVHVQEWELILKHFVGLLSYFLFEWKVLLVWGHWQVVLKHLSTWVRPKAVERKGERFLFWQIH